jgi:eukaryotic-like serine/threonine-protein kinase
MLNPGDTLQARHYQIQQCLSQRGMSTVYLACDRTLPGRIVVIKENQDSLPAIRQQFYHEAAILAQLAHHHLPRVTDYFVEPTDQQYLVMEYIPGDDLRQILRTQRNPLTEQVVLPWIQQVMSALTYMHGWLDPTTGRLTPVIHRDIKPSNVKCTADNHIMLVDFGLVQYETGAAQNGPLGVTPGYSPPEQYRGATDTRSDLYALGATLYTLLTAEKPPDATGLANGRPLPTPRQLNPRISRNTEHVILYAMHLQPHNRFQSVPEMHEALFG